MASEERIKHAQNRCHKIMDRFGDAPTVGIETGVFGGTLCSTMMPMYPNLKLYGIDPYREFSMRPEWPQERWDDLHNAVIKMMEPWSSSWQLIRLPALEAATQFLSQSVDFAYLDDDHSYEAVKAELPVFEQIVREGGMLGGHDFNEAYPGVLEAVFEYAMEHNRNLVIDASVDMWWWTVK